MKKTRKRVASEGQPNYKQEEVTYRFTQSTFHRLELLDYLCYAWN